LNYWRVKLKNQLKKHSQLPENDKLLELWDLDNTIEGWLKIFYKDQFLTNPLLNDEKKKKSIRKNDKNNKTSQPWLTS
jgi:hypothetical protein